MKLLNSTPYYKQIREEFHSRIQKEQWMEGDRIPSERELCEEFGVSRITIRQAIGQAVNEGILETHPGKGTFVRKRKAGKGFMENISFSEMIRNLNKEPKSKILDCNTTSLTIKDSKLIELFGVRRSINLVILGLGDDEPLIVYSSFFPYELGLKVVEKAKERVSRSLPFSTYDLYQDGIGVFPSKAHQNYEAIQADRKIANILKIPLKSPLFLIKSIFYTFDDKPLEYREATYRGDSFIFHVKRVF